MKAEIIHAGDPAITGEIDHTSEPGRPVVRLESGCNEFWLDKEQAESLIVYLQRVAPTLNGVPE